MRDRTAAVKRPSVIAAVKRAEKAVAGRGRLLLRPSGTEGVVRVTVEGGTREECAQIWGSPWVAQRVCPIAVLPLSRSASGIRLLTLPPRFT